jgi:hypothetical protein
MAGYLAEKGYAVWVSEWFPITKYGARHRWRNLRPWPCDLEDSEAWGNLVAVEPALAETASQQWKSFVR